MTANAAWMMFRSPSHRLTSSRASSTWATGHPLPWPRLHPRCTRPQDECISMTCGNITRPNSQTGALPHLVQEEQHLPPAAARSPPEASSHQGLLLHRVQAVLEQRVQCPVPVQQHRDPLCLRCDMTGRAYVAIERGGQSIHRATVATARLRRTTKMLWTGVWRPWPRRTSVRLLEVNHAFEARCTRSPPDAANTNI